MRIIKQVIVLVSVFLLLSCSERVDRTDLQELIKNRQFSSLIEVVDGYIEENEDDEFRSGPQFSDMTLSGRSVLIVPNNTGTDYD